MSGRRTPVSSGRAHGPRGGFPVGHGASCAHHGELVQGEFRADGGALRPGLVTIPALSRTARARFVPGGSPSEGVLGDPHRPKALKAARLVLEDCRSRGLPHPESGVLRHRTSIPAGWGMGSYTADVVATIRAVAASCRIHYSAERIAALAVAAETASDPLPFGRRPVLFGHRDGTVLQSWETPPMWLMGCRCSQEPVDTLALGRSAPARSPQALDRFHRLREDLDRAMTDCDACGLGEVATQSALLNQEILPKEELPDLLELCDRVGGVGVQVAHSGTVAGILLPADARDRLPAVRSAMDRAGLRPTLCLGLSGREGPVPRLGPRPRSGPRTGSHARRRR